MSLTMVPSSVQTALNVASTLRISSFAKYFTWTSLGKALSNTLQIVDNRTGKSYTVPIIHNAIWAPLLLQIKSPEAPGTEADQGERGLRMFDPGLRNTTVIKSEITYVDGDKGQIQYRGYSIEDIVGKKDYLEVVHLLMWGRWPSKYEASNLQQKIWEVEVPTENAMKVIKAFQPSDPPGMMVSAGIAAVGSARRENLPFYQGKNLFYDNIPLVDEVVVQMLSELAVVTAIAYCHHTGREYSPPKAGKSYIENFLIMIGSVDEKTGEPSAHHVDILNRLWTLTLDHEMTCSTAAFLHASSALCDPYSCFVSANSTGTGILHGGAIEVAHKAYEEIGTPERVEQKMERVRAKKERLIGYGHRVYRVDDPRYKHIKQMIEELRDEVEKDPLLRVARQIDNIAQHDEYFTSRSLKPNADLLSSFVYKALGVPTDLILALSSLSRSAGCLAHWREAMATPPAIMRPGQLYVGELDR